jgi:hypothetical protein
MNEWDGQDVALLAPHVDESRSRELFDRRRSRTRRRRRLGVAVSGVAVLAFMIVGAAIWLSDDGTVDVETGYVDQPQPGEVAQSPFEVLDVRGALDRMGTLRAAVTQDELDALWSTVGYEDSPPVVDFDRWVLVTITIPDDACPPTLTGFDRVQTLELPREGMQPNTTTLTPVFEEPNTPCNQPLIARTFVVLLKRSTVSPAFILHLPATNPNYYVGERFLEVQVEDEGPTTEQATERRPLDQWFEATELRPCVYHDEAKVCLDNPDGDGTVALRATLLQPGSQLRVWLAGEERTYTIGAEPDGVVATFPEPTAGSTLHMIVRGTTSTGELIAGPLRVG